MSNPISKLFTVANGLFSNLIRKTEISAGDSRDGMFIQLSSVDEKKLKPEENNYHEKAENNNKNSIKERVGQVQ